MVFEGGEQVHPIPEEERLVEVLKLGEVGASAVGAPHVLPLIPSVVARAAHVGPVCIQVCYELPERIHGEPALGAAAISHGLTRPAVVRLEALHEEVQCWFAGGREAALCEESATAVGARPTGRFAILYLGSMTTKFDLLGLTLPHREH